MGILAGLLPGFIKEGLGFWKETRKAKHDMKMAGIQNRTRLLMSEQEANHEWEMKALETSSKSLKWYSLMLFSSPIIITVVNPEYGSEIWMNLGQVPDGFLQIFYAMTGAIWGIASLKDHGISFKTLFNKKKDA